MEVLEDTKSSLKCKFKFILFVCPEQVLVQQIQPPHHKESNGLISHVGDRQSPEETDVFLPEAQALITEFETTVWDHSSVSNFAKILQKRHGLKNKKTWMLFYFFIAFASRQKKRALTSKWEVRADVTLEPSKNLF